MKKKKLNPGRLKKLQQECDIDLARIRHRLSLSVVERMNFLRKRLPGGGSVL